MNIKKRLGWTDRDTDEWIIALGVLFMVYEVHFTFFMHQIITLSHF